MTEEIEMYSREAVDGMVKGLIRVLAVTNRMIAENMISQDGRGREEVAQLYRDIAATEENALTRSFFETIANSTAEGAEANAPTPSLTVIDGGKRD